MAFSGMFTHVHSLQCALPQHIRGRRRIAGPREAAPSLRSAEVCYRLPGLETVTTEALRASVARFRAGELEVQELG